MFRGSSKDVCWPCWPYYQLSRIKIVEGDFGGASFNAPCCENATQHGGYQEWDSVLGAVQPHLPEFGLGASWLYGLRDPADLHLGQPHASSAARRGRGLRRWGGHESV